MTLLDFFTRLALVFSSEVLIVPIVVLGFLSLHKRIFGNGLTILLFSMVFNAFLKGIFAVLLNPALSSSDFALPSGHMQVSFVFYGWIFLNYQVIWLRLLIPIVVVSIGYSLVYYEYHTTIDVLTAVGFSVVTLAVLYPLTQHRKFKQAPFLLGAYLAVLCAIMIIYTWLNSFISPPIWLAVCVLASFTMSWAVCDASMPLRLPIRAGVGSFLVIIAIYSSFAVVQKYVHLGDEIHWLLVGLLLPLASKIAAARLPNTKSE